MLDYFNVAKSIWTIVYDLTDIKPKINKKHIKNKLGYFYYVNDTTLNIWEYKLSSSLDGEKQLQVIEIYSGDKLDLTIKEIIYNICNRAIGHRPIIEMINKQLLPINETLLPIFKRKLQTFII